MGVSEPGHSSAVRWVATIYPQSCRVVGRRGAGPLHFGGGLPLLGAQRDLLQPPVCGDLPGPLGPLGKAIHRLAKVLLRLQMESSVSRDLRSHVPQM